METLIIFLIVIGAAALITIIAFLIHRLMHPKLKDEKKDEAECAQEELDRVLVPIDDKKTAEEISNYHDKEDEK